ncbi:MAG: leucine-rich repeat domain-containing protein [Oscillospiraceae bacterium]|nr:leucine-rich repeat domain-containing protein [Oscillospiraceae bacterium]
MKKIKTAVMLLSVILAVQAFSFPVYALRDNKYIIDSKKDYYEYDEISYEWSWITNEKNRDNIILFDGNRPPTEVGIVDDAGIRYYPDHPVTKLVPDSINGKPVVEIEGSCVASEFDLNPKNKYMECIDNVIFGKDGKTLMSYSQNNPRESYSIPEGTEVIGCLAIAYSDNLKEVIIPESTNKIDYAAFVGCDKLSEVIFLPGNSEMYIEEYAFWSSYNLKEITLPSFNVKIDRSAFDKSVDVPLLITYEQPVPKAENRTIKWDKIPNASYYEVYQKLSNGEYKLLKTTKGTSCKFTTLKQGSEYIFAVKPIAVIPAANYDKKEDEGYFPETFTVEGTMSEDIAVQG